MNIYATCESALSVIIVIFCCLNYSLHHYNYQYASNKDDINNWFKPALGFSRKENLYHSAYGDSFRKVFHAIGYDIRVNPDYEDGPHKAGLVLKLVDLPKLVNVLKTSSGLTKQAEIIGLYYSIPWLNDVIASKASLLARGGKYIPKAFHLPKQLQEFKNHVKQLDATGNATSHWFQKNAQTRGHAVKEINQINLEAESIVQQFVSNPFLIEDRKFTIAMYVIFTSAHPVRAYIVKSEVIIRACGKGYYPLDPHDPATYVSENPEIYDIKFAKDFRYLDDCISRAGYSYKTALDTCLASVGYNPKDMYAQIYDAIDDVIKTRIHLVNQPDDSKMKYYQITRWDFLLDEDFNIHLIEVEGIPTLPSGVWRFDRVGIHILYNIARLSGLGDINSFQDRPSTYILRDGDVYVDLEICYKNFCKSCAKKECQLCAQCLSTDDKNVLNTVYLEHLNMRGNMKLAYPVVNDTGDNMYADDDLKKDGSNTLTMAWLRAKCKEDIFWCRDSLL